MSDALSWPGSSGAGDAPRVKGSWNSLNPPDLTFHIGDRTTVGKNVHDELLIARRQDLFFLVRWQGLFGTGAAANQGCRRQREWHAHRRSRQGVTSLPRFEVSCSFGPANEVHAARCQRSPGPPACARPAAALSSRDNRAEWLIVGRAANRPDLVAVPVGPHQLSDVLAGVVRDAACSGCAEHRPGRGEEVLDPLGYRERLAERTRRFHIHALRHQDAFTNEDDDVGIDPLRVRARAHDRPRALLELNGSRVPFAVIESELGESHFPLAIVEARRVEEALAVWEEPRPVHARFALRLIAGQNLGTGVPPAAGTASIDVPLARPSRMTPSAPQVPWLKAASYVADRHHSAVGQVDALQLALREERERPAVRRPEH